MLNFFTFKKNVFSSEEEKKETLKFVLKSNRFDNYEKKYIKEFSKIEKNKPSELIEIHNRPNYLFDLVGLIGKRN